MRYVYSIIKFVPDPARGESINVGAVVGSEESSEWELRQIENPVRARALDERGTLPAVWQFMDRLGRDIDRYEEGLETLAEHSVELSEAWLGRLQTIHRNIVQLTPPTPIVASSASDALDKIFDELIVDPTRLTYAFQKKHAALAAVRRSYQHHGLRKEANVFERVLLTASNHRERLDFAVTNRRVVQLANTWSFQVPDQEGLAEQVKAWGWTIQAVRDDGGEIRLAGGESFEVPNEVDIEVVYVPPAPDQSAPAFEEANSVFVKVNVHSVPFDAAEDVGARAEQSLRRGRQIG